MNKEIVKIKKDGKEIECETLFTFDCVQTARHYIAYTDHSLSKKGEENIYVSAYDFGLDTNYLQDLSDAEMEMVNDVIKKIKESN